MDILWAAGFVVLGTLLGTGTVGVVVWLLVRAVVAPMRETNDRLVGTMEQTNRTLQVSLMAYHSSHPSVAAIATKGLADRSVKMAEQPQAVEEDVPASKKPGGVTLRVGDEMS